MKTLLEAIQKHEDTFIHTLQHRQFTSTANKELHQKMIEVVESHNWEGVSEKSKIIDLFNEGKFV